VSTFTIAGAGMGGLCAAARARELGGRPVVLEKGDRAGGSMLLSSGVVWRHRSLDDFRAECPGGDPRLQQLVFERLDEGLAWLESLGAPVVARETGNPRTTGIRFDPRGLTDALVSAAGEIRFAEPLRAQGHFRGSDSGTGLDGAQVLATGGFQGDQELIARHVTPHARRLWLRANRWSTGDGLRLALERGAKLSSGLDEFYGRNMPAPPARVTEERFVELAQLYGRHALVVNERGEEFAPEPLSWSETDLVQATARQPGARSWYIVDSRALGEQVRERTVAEMIAAAESVGGTVHRADNLDELRRRIELPKLPRSDKLVAPPFTAVHVAPGITHTIGGLAVDEHARVKRSDGTWIDGLYACGADVGGIATGGYASGLAAALVLGRIAAETALADPI
jgi:fumarate reductase flavoprotein subunit